MMPGLGGCRNGTKVDVFTRGSRLPVVALKIVDQSDVRRLEKRHKDLAGISLLAIVALVIQTGLLLLSLFGPALPYIVSNAQANDLSSDEFLNTLGAITGARLDCVPAGGAS